MEPLMNAMMPAQAAAQQDTPAPIQRPTQAITPTRPDPQMQPEGAAGMSPQMQMLMALFMMLMQGGQGQPQGQPMMPGAGMAPPAGMPAAAPPMMPPAGFGG